MDLAKNLESIRQLCRVCLQKGDINIWNFKVKFTADETNYISSQCSNVFAQEDTATDDAKEERYINTFELLEIFNKSTDSLVLPEEFPSLCWQCLEDFRLCYIFHEKVKNSNLQMKKIHEEFVNQCIEEEHLLEPEVESNLGDIKIEDVVEGIEFISEAIDLPTIPEMLHVKSSDNRTSKRMTLDRNSSIVVTQFIPTALEPPLNTLRLNTQPGDDEEFQPPRNLHTVDCTTVEIKDPNQLESLETSAIVEVDENTYTTIPPPVFVCQFCPQAFAKSEFLKTHVQKNHVCKFCMQTFHQYTELCQHLRQHTENKCVICHKMFSSHTNLRHHIKRIHRINLPPKMTLLDFIQSKDDEDENENENLLPDALPEMLFNDVIDQVEAKGYERDSLADTDMSTEVGVGVDVEGLISADGMVINTI